MDLASKEAVLCLNRLFEGRAGAALVRWARMGRLPREVISGPAALEEAGFPRGGWSRVEEAMRTGWARRELDRASSMGIGVLALGEEGYPESLLELSDPPAALYVRGTRGIPLRPQGAVSVVGTRRASTYGLKVAMAVGERCAGSSLWTVSGGAMGIDGAAHQGALSKGGLTCAVLGNGVDVVFPADHRELFELVARDGCLVSEYPLGTKGSQWRFPMRNRIIAALSARLVVVEAPERSGALITASKALDLGREVWAVPGKIGEAQCRGSNLLIYDGAMPLVDLDLLFPPGEDRGSSRQVDPLEGAILQVMASEGDWTVDKLALECKIGAADLLSRLAILEARGLVYRSSPGRYSLSPGAGA